MLLAALRFKANDLRSTFVFEDHGRGERLPQHDHFVQHNTVNQQRQLTYSFTITQKNKDPYPIRLACPSLTTPALEIIHKEHLNIRKEIKAFFRDKPIPGGFRGSSPDWGY